MRGAFLLLSVLVVSALVLAQPALTFPPPKVNPPDEDTLKAIREKTEALRAAIKKEKSPSPDILVFLKAAEYMLRHKEWYGKQAQMTVEVLDEGLRRVKVNGGRSDWKPGSVNVGAYRSTVDGSIQPYLLTWPAGKDAPRPLHVVLHGRNAGLTEASFLHRAIKGKAPKGLDHVVLEVYGRGNNAYRWAGESDVWEALRDCGSRYFGKFLPFNGKPPAGRPPVLRGFSMGGAGAWHIGLHHPSRFSVIGPGAGFTTTYGYIGGLKKLPPHQDACLKIYDAVEYAENAFNVPVVAYSGADDPQKAAADNIDKALGKLGLKMTHLIAPKTKHTIPPAYRQKLEKEYARHAVAERPRFKPKVRFVTYTLRYNECEWVRLEGLERHYERARVEGERTAAGADVKTENVRAISLHLMGLANLKIDGQEIKGINTGGPRGGFVNFEKKGGKWALVKEWSDATAKAPGLQGPIDDAFMTPFLCVRGTGKAWSPSVQAHAAASLARFRKEWSKYLRGDIRIKDDKDVTEQDIRDYSLILFGGPGSNSLIAKVMPKMPFTWTRKGVNWNGKEHAPDHVPVLIQRNPLNPYQYLVFNSGHTFHAKDFQGTNALLYPRLGDWALLKVKDAKKPLDVEVVTAGLFDEQWKFPK